MDEVEFEDEDETREIFESFTNISAFNVARQMFLDNHNVVEINAAFALGAALQQEPELLLNLSFEYVPDSELSNTDESQGYPGDVIYDDEYSTDTIVDVDTDEARRHTQDAQNEPYVEDIDTLLDIQLTMYELGIDEDELTAIMTYGSAIMYFAFEPLSSDTDILPKNLTANPFELGFNADESVCLQTGSSIFRTNVLNIPGRGDFGLNLDLVYRSSNADLVTGRTDQRQRLHGTGWSAQWVTYYVNATTPRHGFRGLANGWMFDLPYVLYGVLYVPGQGYFQVRGQAHNVRPMVGMSFSLTLGDNRFQSGNLMSTDMLRFYNGTRYYFSGNYIIGMRDRFGNTIRFEYSSHVRYEGRRLMRIIDTNNNVINFRYEDSFIMVGNQRTNTRTVTVTTHDQSTFVMNMSEVPEHRERLRLDSVRNQMNAVTRFEYSVEMDSFNLVLNDITGRPDGDMPIHILLLDRAIYPSGARLEFNYALIRPPVYTFFGRRSTRRVDRRHLLSNGRNYQETHFSYRERVAPVLRDSYLTTTVTQNNGQRTVYTFDYRHLNTLIRTYNGNVLLSEQVTTFANRYNQQINGALRYLPTSIVQAEHRGGNRRATHQVLQYNIQGQVTQSLHPLANGVNLERYRITQTYNWRYGLPLVTTFWADANTQIRQVNHLCPDERNIIRTNVYENNVRQSSTGFQHDTHGNVIQINEFIDVNATFANVNNAVITSISYSSWTMPFNIFTQGVRDANGELTVGNGIVTRGFMYDSMWRSVMEIENSYATHFRRDRLGRITAITHPNEGVETFTYNDQANTLAHRTVLGASYLYRYDPLGNLQSVSVNGTTIFNQHLRYSHEAYRNEKCWGSSLVRAYCLHIRCI